MEETSKKPKLTHFMIFLCFSVFFIEVVFNFFFGKEGVAWLFYNFGFSSTALDNGMFWTPLTSIFLHASPEHLILNMIALYFFGRSIELSLGRKKFLLIFFGSALLGDLFIYSGSLLGIYPSDIPTVGASAGIFGLLGAAMLVRPFDLVFYPYLIPVPLVLVAILYVMYNIGGFIASVVSPEQAGISYLSHLGGFLGGIIFALREERSKRGLLIALVLVGILLSVPLAWKILELMETANYTQAVGSVL
ncbi:MAG: rhomboid family intramembrane serine protease [Candidatus Micrarchaeota archaeon]|nr:rhomboid family intramembrane serine protease [Candidatus Micrarchaeota archaeon]